MSASATPSVVRYIQDQKKHHARRSYENEFRALLRAHGIPFNDEDLFS